MFWSERFHTGRIQIPHRARIFAIIGVIVLGILTHSTTAHKTIKINTNRVHVEGRTIQIPEERIHLRESGLEDFVKVHKETPDVLKVDKFVRNKEHIKLHGGGEYGHDLDNASEEELDFHFFQVHDTDDNKALDGIELLEAVMHGLEEQFEDIEDDEELTPSERKEEADLLFDLAYESVDNVLTSDDVNSDGYISVDEFLKSRRLTEVFRDAHVENY